MPSSSTPRFAFLTFFVVALCTVFIWLEERSYSRIRPDAFEYRDGAVTLTAYQVPLKTLLEEISAVAGVQIYVFDPTQGIRVSADFGARPLRGALQAILKGFSYAIVYPDEIFLQMRGKEEPEHFVDTPDSKEQAGSETAVSSVVSYERDEPVDLEMAEDPVFARGIHYGTHTRQHSTATSHEEKAGELILWTKRAMRNPNRMVVSSAENGSPEKVFYTENTSGKNGGSSGSGTTGPNTGSHLTGGHTHAGSSSGERQSMTRRERLMLRINTLERRIASGESDRAYQSALSVRSAEYVQHDRELLEYYKESLSQL